MSRTESHRPYRARLSQRHLLIQVHDHQDGPCDLPSLATWQAELKSDTRARVVHERYRCAWQIAPEELRGLCGCPQCTQKHERRTQRRRLRHSKPGEIRAALRDAETDALLTESQADYEPGAGTEFEA